MPTSKPRLPRTLLSGRMVTTFDREVMGQICLEVASGKPLTKVMADNKYSMSISTLYSWLDKWPEAAEMMAKARLLRSFHYEDRSMEAVDELLDKDTPIDKDQVRARDVALHQMRWLMGKWNPMFNDQVKPVPMVAIQINSNALGEGEGVDHSTFHMEVTVPEEKPNE